MNKSRIEDEDASLIGVSLDELGRTRVSTQHRDGRTDTLVLESESWESGPQEWKPAGGALEERKRGALTRLERIDQSIRMEAAALKSLSSITGVPNPRQHAHLILAELLIAMGGEWAEKASVFALATNE